MGERKYMNFDLKLEILQGQFDQLKSDYEECLQFTNAILKKAEEYKIKNIGINKTSKLVQENPWTRAPHSLFAKEDDDLGHPIVWKLARDFFPASCGNGDQYQIPADATVIDGIYSFNNGKWTKKD